MLSHSASPSRRPKSTTNRHSTAVHTKYTHYHTWADTQFQLAPFSHRTSLLHCLDIQTYKHTIIQVVHLYEEWQEHNRSPVNDHELHAQGQYYTILKPIRVCNTIVNVWQLASQKCNIQYTHMHNVQKCVDIYTYARYYYIDKCLITLWLNISITIQCVTFMHAWMNI